MKDRLTREKERLAHVWQSLAPEQQEMRKQSERLNALTKELEAFRSEIVSLEEACKLAGYYTDGSAAGARAMFENAMAREGVLVETCKVENMIKGSLDITERLLEREKKTLHKVNDVPLANHTPINQRIFRSSSGCAWKNSGISPTAFGEGT